MVARRKNRAREFARDARKVTARRNDAIAQLRSWHWSLRDIAAEVELSHTAVKKILDRREGR